VFYVSVLSFIRYVSQFLMYYYDVSCFGVFTAAKLVHKKIPLIFLNKSDS